MMEEATWPSQMLLKSLKALAKFLKTLLQFLKTLLKFLSMLFEDLRALVLQDHMVGWPVESLKALLKLLAMFLLHKKRWKWRPSSGLLR